MITEINLKTGKRTTRDWTEEEKAAHEAAMPTVFDLWLAEMQESDSLLPRYAEDIIDALPQASREALAPETFRKYNDKKNKRAGKP